MKHVISIRMMRKKKIRLNSKDQYVSKLNTNLNAAQMWLFK